MPGMKPRYFVTPRLRTAVRHSERARQELARSVGLTASQLAHFVTAGAWFGDVVRERIERLGAQLGVAAKRCTQRRPPDSSGPATAE